MNTKSYTRKPVTMPTIPATNPPVATPTTTGTTRTRAVVATLMWLRNGNMTAPRATTRATANAEATADWGNMSTRGPLAGAARGSTDGAVPPSGTDAEEVDPSR